MRSSPYFFWLRSQVEKGHTSIKEKQLIVKLYNTDYFSLIPNDDNRGMDGIELRNEYVESGGLQHALPFGVCTVLEMFVALSRRLEFESFQSKWEKSPGEWFWVLVDNLGLSDIVNEDLTIPEYASKIEECVTVFLERRYKGNGEGGLFPLKHPKNDQKRVEIWYQMSAFMLENYPI